MGKIKLTVSHKVIENLVEELRFKSDSVIQEEDITAIDFKADYMKVITTKGTFDVYYMDLYVGFTDVDE